jgi:ComF family protein
MGAPIICSACVRTLESVPLHTACLKCKAPLGAAQICGECLKVSWHFKQLEVPFYHNAMAKYLLHHLKFYRQLLFIPKLSDLLIVHLQDYFKMTRPDVIVPVPLHRWRILRRGFNQAHELAKRLGRAYGIPLRPELAKKVKHTEAQARLQKSARQKNIHASFKVNLQHNFQHILLLDDVFTTGATINALAHEFKKAGAVRVDVVTLFRAS